MLTLCAQIHDMVNISIQEHLQFFQITAISLFAAYFTSNKYRYHVIKKLRACIHVCGCHLLILRLQNTYTMIKFNVTVMTCYVDTINLRLFITAQDENTAEN